MLKSFASFTLSGKLPAFTVVFGFLIFALAFPLSAIVSGAALVLLTLHAGPKNSIFIVIACILGLAICSYLFIANTSLGALTAIAQLVPSYILATVLYSTRSLSLSMQTSALLGAIAFIFTTAMFPDTQPFWQTVLTPILSPVLEAGGNTQEQISLVITQTAKYMTGLLIASIVLVHSSILLFGYKLYSLVNSNVQFDSDFLQLRPGQSACHTGCNHRYLGICNAICICRPIMRNLDYPVLFTRHGGHTYHLWDHDKRQALVNNYLYISDLRAAGDSHRHPAWII